jgi:hypothetical protein
VIGRSKFRKLLDFKLSQCGKFGEWTFSGGWILEETAALGEFSTEESPSFKLLTK